MIIETLSASAIKTFEQCPKKFWAEYVLKLSSPPHPLTRVGSCLHSILEKTVNARINSPLDLDAHSSLFHLDSTIQKYGIDIDGRNDVIALIKSAETLGYFDNIRYVVGCEVKLKFELEGFKFKGFMDRLDINGEEAFIHDIKTSSRKIEDEVNQWQTVMYSLGVRKNYPTVKNIKMCYWELRHYKNKSDIVITEVPIDNGVENLIKISKEIVNCPDDSSPKPSKLCRFCAHTNCKFKKIFGGR